MQIISHRGYWKNSAEKNSPTALERSFSMGFGTETDFRDHLGDLVVAHDPPSSPSIHHTSPIAADFCFQLLAQHGLTLPQRNAPLRCLWAQGKRHFPRLSRGTLLPSSREPMKLYPLAGGTGSEFNPER
jgi:glycerophosphoryl diester phosphodiesterase